MYSSGGGGERISCFPWSLPSASRTTLRIIWSVFKTDLHSRREWNTFNWLLSFTFLVCLLPLSGSTHAVRGVCREEALSNHGSERPGDNSRAPSFAFSTLLAQSFDSSIWGWCSSLLVYFKELTCSAQTSSLGEWREPVTAARAVPAAVICMPFPPSHFLQLSACFPREIEKGQLHFSPERKLSLGVKWQETWNHSLCRGLKATSRCPLCVNQFPAPARHRRWQRPGPALRLARHERRLGTSEVERVTWWAQ